MVLLHVQHYCNYAAVMSPAGKSMAGTESDGSCCNGFTDSSQEILSLWNQDVRCLLLSFTAPFPYMTGCRQQSLSFSPLTLLLIWCFVSFLLSKQVGHSWCPFNPAVCSSKSGLSKNTSSLTVRQIPGRWFHNVTWDSQMECDDL